MKHADIIIIGASFAGIACALTARDLYPDKQIMIVEKGMSIGHIPSNLNMFLKNDIKHLSQKKFITEAFLKEKDIEVCLNHQVLEVNPEESSLVISTENNQYYYYYDRLVLAMGSSPRSERIKGSNLPQVITSKTLSMSEEALEEIEKAEHILIAGGGQIGLEAADAFNAANKKVTLVEAFDRLAFKYFDEDMIQPLEQRMIEQGITIQKGHYVEAIKQGTEKLIIELTREKVLQADNVMLAVNFRPNSGLVADLVACHLDNTIKVDPYLQTSQDNIFAVGDLIRVPHVNMDTNYYLPFVNNAQLTGTTAAMNLFHKTTPMSPSMRVIGTNVFGLYMGGVGLTYEEAIMEYDVETTYLEQAYSDDVPTRVAIKLITERESGKILGAQIHSEVNILSVIDSLALAIKAQVNDQALAFQNRLYYGGEISIIPALYACALKSYQKRLNEVMRDVT